MNTPPFSTSSDQPDRPWIAIGRILRAHGIRGELKIKLYNADSTSLRPGLMVQLQGQQALRKLLRCRSARDLWIISLQGVEDRNQAETLHGVELSVSEDALPPAEPGQYYHRQLIGCVLKDAQEQPIGTVRAVDDHGAHAVLQIQDPHGLWLLPLVDAYVGDVDVGAGIIRVDGVQELIEATRDEEPFS